MSDNSDLDQRIVQEVIGRFAAPSFMRRAKLVETSWTQLIERGTRERLERLQFVRLRLGQFHALAGDWHAIGAWTEQPDDRAELQRLCDELQPCLRLPLEATTSRRVLRAAIRALLEATASFNERWKNWLVEVDLRPIQQARDDYNRFYLLEKECALGSARVARVGFQSLAPVTLDDVAQQLPLLALPRFVGV